MVINEIRSDKLRTDQLGASVMSRQAGLEYERAFWDQGKLVVGIDEAGRGPIAGPLVVAGAVFDIGYTNAEIYDSKALSEKKREQLFSLIIRKPVATKIKIVARKKSMRSISIGRRKAGDGRNRRGHCGWHRPC